MASPKKPCCLKILAAAWGTSNVTEKIWEMVEENGLTVAAENATFGFDPMKGIHKTLVVCYQHPGGKPAIEFAKEGSTLRIQPAWLIPQEEDLLTGDWQTNVSNTSSRNLTGQNTIEILGAAWGAKDVTEHAKKHVLNRTDFDMLASNETLTEDGWCGVIKTLVVIYRYSGIPMMSIVKERETMQFTISPPLFILGAAYGFQVVTNEVQNLVKNHQLVFTPATDLPKSILTSFVMVYQFGNEEPILYFSNQPVVNIKYPYNQKREIKKEAVTVDPHQMIILGAAYNSEDVTTTIRKRVNENKIEALSVNDTTMGVKDKAWMRHVKALVVVYRYGTGPPMVSITEGEKTADIKKMVPPIYGGLIDSKNLLSNTDTISLIAVNNKYVTCNSESGKLTVKNDKTSPCEFVIAQPSSNSSFFLHDKESQKYCEVDDEGYLILKGDRGKTGFLLTLSLSGKVQLATDKNKFVRLTDDHSFKADSTEHFSASTSFQIEVDCSLAQNVSEQTPNDEVVSIDEKLWLSFVWRLTGGFFLALGLGPFLTMCEPSVGLLHLLCENRITSKALERLRAELRSTTSETDAIRSGVHFINIVWKEGLLWKVFKFLRLQEGKIIYTEIFARVAQAVLIPETEACLLLTGLTTWATQLMVESKKLGDL